MNAVYIKERETGEALAKEILGVLIKMNFDVKKIRRQSYDGAACAWHQIMLVFRK